MFEKVLFKKLVNRDEINEIIGRVGVLILQGWTGFNLGWVDRDQEVDPEAVLPTLKVIGVARCDAGLVMVETDNADPQYISPYHSENRVYYFCGEPFEVDLKDLVKTATALSQTVNEEGRLFFDTPSGRKSYRVTEIVVKAERDEGVDYPVVPHVAFFDESGRHRARRLDEEFVLVNTLNDEIEQLLVEGGHDV